MEVAAEAAGVWRGVHALKSKVSGLSLECSSVWRSGEGEEEGGHGGYAVLCLVFLQALNSWTTANYYYISSSQHWRWHTEALHTCLLNQWIVKLLFLNHK